MRGWSRTDFRAIFAENDRSEHKIKKCSQIENSVLKIQNKNRWNSNGFMAEGTGLEPAGLSPYRISNAAP